MDFQPSPVPVDLARSPRCSKYKDLRNRIFANVSGRNSLRTILSTPQLATKVIEYMEQTQILGQ
ncbi:hypothetical protein A1F97_11141, partial [Pyrenophora tritici-repentis]